MKTDIVEQKTTADIVADYLAKDLTSFNRYQRNDNSGREKTVHLSRVIEMTDDELYEETKSKIWLSAFASNNPRSDYHWHCDFTYDEWVRRKGNSDMYGKAHKEVSADN